MHYRLENQHWLQTEYKLQGTTTAQAAVTVSDKAALQQRLPWDAQSSGLCLPSAAMAGVHYCVQHEEFLQCL